MCAAIFIISTILTLTSLRFLWSQVKPFFRGKILYTPDTPATRCQYHHHLINIVLISTHPMHCDAIKRSTGRRLVGAVDSSYFRPVESLQAALKQWEETYSEQVAGFVLNKWGFFFGQKHHQQIGMDGKWLDERVMMSLENNIHSDVFLLSGKYKTCFTPLYRQTAQTMPSRPSSLVATSLTKMSTVWENNWRHSFRPITGDITAMETL